MMTLCCCLRRSFDWNKMMYYILIETRVDVLQYLTVSKRIIGGVDR
jgi:hypothetical protein